jgi:N-methylhydantoinase B
MSPTVDPFTLEVIRNALSAIAEEMSLVVMRSARSPLLREAGDLSSALTDASGELIAQGRDIPMHMGVMSFTVKEFLKRVPAGRLKPGDVWFLNLPEVGGNHLPDVKAIRPVFADEELQAFAVSLAHWADIGGAVPGSYVPGATDAWQEGLRLPPLRLFSAEGPDREKLDLVLANLRGAEEREGDILAQMAASRAAEQRLGELFARHGVATVRNAIAGLHDRAEAQMRQALALLPQGTYEGEDWLDDDGAGGEPVPIRVWATARSSISRAPAMPRAGPSTQRPLSPRPRSSMPSRRWSARASSPTAAATGRCGWSRGPARCSSRDRSGRSSAATTRLRSGSPTRSSARSSRRCPSC